MSPAVNSSASELVEQVLQKIPPFPPIAARLLKLLSNDSVSVNEIAELIASDPIFSARILSRVNSAAFGLSHPVGNIRQAVALLGLERTRQLTLTVATSAYTQGALRVVELRRCWEHTVATAILSDEIARACEIFKDNAYSAGIIHDIGRLGLLVAYPKKYTKIIRDADALSLDALDLEREQFGMDHTEIGRTLVERWKLPQEFRLIAGRHHDPCEGGELDLLRVVRVACRLAVALGFGISTTPVTLEPDSILNELPSGARKNLAGSAPDLNAQLEQRIQAYC